MSEPTPLSLHFDDAADLYDEVRPSYPHEIIDQIVRFADLPPEGRVFEVGCGTGQMTRPFAERGYTVVALDQGARLAALAAKHCAPYPRVRIVQCAFEAWQDLPENYDLFLSAQAFHWDSSGLWPRPRRGVVDRSEGSAFWQATDLIYRTYNPVDSSPQPPERRSLSGRVTNLPAVRRYPRGAAPLGEAVHGQ